MANKKLLVLVIFLLLQNKAYTNRVFNGGFLYLAGTIENYDSTSSGIEIHFNDYINLGQIKYQIPVSSNGKFNVSIFIENPTCFSLNYLGKWRSLLGAPGDTLYISFNQLIFPEGIQCLGKAASRNSEFLLYNESLINILTEERLEVMKLTLSEKEGFKKQLDSIYRWKTVYMQKYIKEKQCSGFMVERINNDLKFRYFCDIFDYETGKYFRSNKTQIDSEYLAVLDTLAVMPEYFSSVTFLEFINKAESYANLLVDKEMRGMQISDHELKKDPNIFHNKRQEKFLKLTALFNDNILRDLFITQYYSQLLKNRIDVVNDSSLNLISNVSIRENFRDHVSSMREKISGKCTKTSNYNLLAIPVFNNLLKKYPQKVLYLDFWATWCGHCYSEMNNSKKMMADPSLKDVVFVFLCIRSEKLYGIKELKN